MVPAKVFNNVIIGQFVLTGVPVKVYTGSRYLTITDADDVENPLIGFGMDEDGDMHRFNYTDIIHLRVSSNIVTLDTYNKGMEPESEEVPAEEESPEEEPEEEKDEPPKEESVVKEDHAGYTFGTGDIIKNINPKCKHFGSRGIIKRVGNIQGVGTVAMYTVTNNGDTYKPGMSLTKTVDQLEPIDLGTVKMDEE